MSPAPPCVAATSEAYVQRAHSKASVAGAVGGGSLWAVLRARPQSSRRQGLGRAAPQPLVPRALRADCPRIVTQVPESGLHASPSQNRAFQV